MTVVPLRLVSVPMTEVRNVGLGFVGVAAGLLAVEGLARVQVPVESDYGLVAELPATFWVGLVILQAVFVTALSVRKPNKVLLALLVVVLVVLLYGTPALIDSTPRLEVSWRHLGIAEELRSAQGIDSDIDAYFNWPGFFAGLASLLELMPVSPAHVALVAPTLNGLLWTFGVVALLSSLTVSSHHVWLGAWLFGLFNWIDQEYLSPQAFGYAAYLVMLALLLRYLGSVPRGGGLLPRVRTEGLWQGSLAWWRSRVPTEPDAVRRAVALVLVVLLAAVVVVSHQLTPFMILGALALLTVSGRLWTPQLLFIVGLLAVLWLTTGAASYLAGHPVLFVQQVEQSTDANLPDRFGGTPGHQMVVNVRVALTMALLALAALGFLRMRRQGFRDVRPVLLMAFPFVMVVLQSYGGEMLMRSTLFCLPFAAYYAAGCLIGGTGLSGFRPDASVALVGCVAGALVVTGHFGNAAFDMFTPAEVRAVRQLYQIAPPGSVLISTTHTSPWKSKEYADYNYATMTDDCAVPLKPRACFRVVRDRALHNPTGGYVFVTRSERAALRVRGDAPAGAIDQIEQLLLTRAGGELVVDDGAIQIIRLGGTAPKAAAGEDEEATP